MNPDELKARLAVLRDDLPDDVAPARLLMRNAAEIEPREIEWLWRPWLARSMFHLFAGYGGSGKSTITAKLAASFSVAGTLPDGQRAPLTNTLIFAAEDSPEFTIVPRLDELGANRSRIHLVEGVTRGDDEPGWIQLKNHIALIEAAVRERDIGLVILDPVSSYIGDANSDKEGDVRNGIMPLVRMAERTGAAVVAIRHLSKAGDGSRAASRILGSTAWHDVPRVAWMLADAPDDYQPEPNNDGTRDTKRVLGVVKSNISAKPQARWCMQPANGPLRWLPDPSPVTVDECFAAAGGGNTKTRDAEEWLRERLAGGAQSTRVVEDAAKDAGISKASLRRARAALNIKARKEPSGEWWLSLPPKLKAVKTEGAHDRREYQAAQSSNAFDDSSQPKALTMNALSAFPEPRGNLAIGDGDHDPSTAAEESKAFNSPIYERLERLHQDDPADEWTGSLDL